MSQIDELLARSSCAACGGGVFMNDEGRVACTECGLPTEECPCAGKKPDMSLPV
jgi:hypothetical protein